MTLNEKFNSDFFAISELSKEITTLMKNTINQGHENLSPSDTEHILKITSNVTNKIKSQIQEITI